MDEREGMINSLPDDAFSLLPFPNMEVVQKATLEVLTVESLSYSPALSLLPYVHFPQMPMGFLFEIILANSNFLL